MKRAFSLVELLVVIAVLAVLLSILLPALSMAKRTSQILKSKSNVRSLYGLVAIKVEQNGGEFLALDPDRSDYTIPYWEGVMMGGGHWSATGFLWPLPYEFTPDDLGSPDVLASPGAFLDPESAAPRIDYALTSTVLGSPRLWSCEQNITEEDLPRLRRPVSMSVVALPSMKAAMWDRALGWIDEPETDGPDLAERTPVCAFDGSVKLRVPASLTEGVLCADPNQRAAVEERQAMHNTPGGVRGTDW